RGPSPRRRGRRRHRRQPPPGHARRRLPHPHHPRLARGRAPGGVRMTAVVTAERPTVVHPADQRDDRREWRSLWSDSLVFARRNIEHIRQIPEKLLDVTIQPLMFVLLFAYVFGGAISVTGGSYREYIIGGILVQSVAFGMMGPATSIATDLTEGVIDRFRSLPTRRAAYLIGHYLAELAGMMLGVVILLGAGLIEIGRASCRGR